MSVSFKSPTMKVLSSLLLLILVAVSEGCSVQELQELDARIKELESTIRRQADSSIQFVAYKTQLEGESDDETYIPAGVQITFDDTIINFGNGFDTRSSEFIAPIAGTYIFFFSSECMDTTIHCHTELRVNNQPVSGLHDDVASEIVAHQTAWFSVQSLNSGDSVTVHTEDNEFEDQVLYYAHNDITFYGYLLE